MMMQYCVPAKNTPMSSKSPNCSSGSGRHVSAAYGSSASVEMPKL